MCMCKTNIFDEVMPTNSTVRHVVVLVASKRDVWSQWIITITAHNCPDVINKETSPWFCQFKDLMKCLMTLVPIAMPPNLLAMPFTHAVIELVMVQIIEPSEKRGPNKRSSTLPSQCTCRCITKPRTIASPVCRVEGKGLTHTACTCLEKTRIITLRCCTSGERELNWWW